MTRKRAKLDLVTFERKSKTGQQVHFTVTSNISSHKYVYDKIATLKMVDLDCSKIHPKLPPPWWT
jgi:hypothetical protein